MKPTFGTLEWGKKNNGVLTRSEQFHFLRNMAFLEVERIALRHIVEYCTNGMHPMITRDSLSGGLFDASGYPYSVQARVDVQRAIGRAWKALDDAGFIEEPDADNGKNRYRVPSAAGKKVYASAHYVGARMRSKFAERCFIRGCLMPHGTPSTWETMTRRFLKPLNQSRSWCGRRAASPPRILVHRL
jgi:hypothetical protein